MFEIRDGIIYQLGLDFLGFLREKKMGGITLDGN